MKLSAAVPLLFVILVSAPFLAGEAGIPDLSGKILTVLGPIDPSELGPTLGHEHILIDYTRGNKEGRLKTATQAAGYLEPLTLKNLSDVRAGLVLNRDNLLLTDVDLAIREVLEFKRWGGDGIIDTTSIGLGRDPEGLSQIARGSGLDIIMGAGYYVESYHPPRNGEVDGGRGGPEHHQRHHGGGRRNTHSFGDHRGGRRRQLLERSPDQEHPGLGPGQSRHRGSHLLSPWREG